MVTVHWYPVFGPKGQTEISVSHKRLCNYIMKLFIFAIMWERLRCVTEKHMYSSVKCRRLCSDVYCLKNNSSANKFSHKYICNLMLKDKFQMLLAHVCVSLCFLTIPDVYTEINPGACSLAAL